MLAQYRLLAAVTGETGDTWQGSDTIVRQGDTAEALDVLYRLLVGFGDLPERAPVPGATYDAVLADGIKHFQRRHGLDTDGVLGARTQAALRVPLEWRVRQIELALERLRWLPRLGDRRLVVLNIPMFRIWAWDAIPPSGEPVLGVNAIVGRALKTETPVFIEEMREIVFRPYWNVPPSILRKETLPLIARDPGYLSRENMEIVRGQGDDARPVEATPENVAMLRQGALRLRQRPGPSNALGLIKFVFPNEENVYMHGTPAKTLFARSRRDFSHGCVRVEDPVALAEWALKDRPEWSREHILAAMEGPQPLRVKLAHPIQVILFYTTAAVMPEDGTIRFAEDIYGHDQRLDRALSSLPTPR
jgi:murein L,D-transpeptidase YcbB/YkuD